VDNIKRLGVLTGGGDAPGLNPAIREFSTKLWNWDMRS